MDISSNVLNMLLGRRMVLWSNNSNFVTITSYAESPVAKLYVNYSTIAYTWDAVKYALVNYKANNQLLQELITIMPEEFI